MYGDRIQDQSFSYVLPVAAAQPVLGGELRHYLAGLTSRCEVVVVDGSPPEVAAAHARSLPEGVRHVLPEIRTPMGKVGNVLAGVAVSSHERIVIADDDVRYGDELEDVVALLSRADVVRPQNYFSPLPWHAVWDSGRILVARATGGDWPGTLAVRRSVLERAGGYAGDVMFENYELCRTVEEAGGCHLLADDLFVRRLPPTSSHFLGQRVRQAYDELARPGRLVLSLIPLPTVLVLGLAGRWVACRRTAALLVAGALGLAEAGRRRRGAATYFPFRCTLGAPLWMAERSFCAWLALGARLRGGVRYRGGRLRWAALPPAERARRRAAAASAVAPGAAGAAGTRLSGPAPGRNWR